MKTFVLATLSIFAFTQTSMAVAVTANLRGQVTETQQVQTDGHPSTTVVGSASLVEVSRSESADVINVYLMAQAGKAEYLSVLHDASDVALTLDLNTMAPRGESSQVKVTMKIQGDDDQFRKANGDCLLNVDSTLLCTLTPTFNAFGLLENTSLSLSLN